MVDGVYLPGTFQPTFLYECIWDLATVGLVLLVERKVKLRRGYLFAAYAAIYTFGRFFTEYLRIDPSHRYLGLRLNDWTSVGVFVVAGAILLLKGGRSRATTWWASRSRPRCRQGKKPGRTRRPGAGNRPRPNRRPRPQRQESRGPTGSRQAAGADKPSKDDEAGAADGAHGEQPAVIGGEAAATAVAVATKVESGAAEATTEDRSGGDRRAGDEGSGEDSPGGESLEGESPEGESPEGESLPRCEPARAQRLRPRWRARRRTPDRNRPSPPPRTARGAGDRAPEADNAPVSSTSAPKGPARCPRRPYQDGETT